MANWQFIILLCLIAYLGGFVVQRLGKINNRLVDLCEQAGVHRRIWN